MQIPLPFAVATAYLYEAIAAITRKPPLTTPGWVKVGSHYSFWDSSKAVPRAGPAADARPRKPEEGHRLVPREGIPVIGLFD